MVEPAGDRRKVIETSPRTNVWPSASGVEFVSGAPSATFGDVLVPLPGRELVMGVRLKF